MNRRLPVTLVGGFPGAGKTSLLHHFMSEQRGGYLAVLVENIGPLNVDAQALRGLCGAMRRSHDTVREIPAGDESAQVKWIAAQLREFAEVGSFERVLVEVSGMSNAAWLGRHFALLPDHATTFAPWAQLHEVICVVDALDFYRVIVRPPPGARRDSLAELQREQIARASVVVLNKCDLVDDAMRISCARAVQRINPEARVAEVAYGEVAPELWSGGATPHELGLAVERPLAPLAEDAPAAMELSCALYRAWRPFHPARFWAWFDAEHTGLLRTKGVIWLAARNLLVGGVSRTRWQNACGPAGIWWAALPREEWPTDPEALMRMQETWREPYGDRRQELVLIGDAKLLAHLNRGLDACLLTDDEFARPIAEWSTLPDPFPAWDLQE